jgi:hypothetical protein
MTALVTPPRIRVSPPLNLLDPPSPFSDFFSDYRPQSPTQADSPFLVNQPSTRAQRIRDLSPEDVDMPLMHELGLMTLESWSDSIRTGMAELSASGPNIDEFCLRAPTLAVAKVLLYRYISHGLGGPTVTTSDLIPPGGDGSDFFVAGSGLQSLFLDDSDQSFDMYVIIFLNASIS